MKQKHLCVWIGIAAMAFGVVARVEAKTRKGDKFLKEGKAAELRQDWDAAVVSYQQAFDEDPSDTAYIIAIRHARFESGQKHVDVAQKLRSDGKLSEALAEFQKALIADPSSAIAIQEIKRTRTMIEDGAKPGAKTEDRGLSPSDREKKNVQERVESMLAPPELKPVTMPPMFKINNQPVKVLFDTVGAVGHINVVYDSGLQPNPARYNVNLEGQSIDQALDYIALLTHTFWKPITANAIFVTDDNVTKRRDYEDEVVKVFYITNATSVQEFTEIATAIRTVAEIRRVFTYNAQKAMIVRDTVDKVALAEKLVHDLDKPKSEVVVDLIVMQANSDRTRDLAATLASLGSSGLSPGVNVPVNFGSTTTTDSNNGGTPTTTGSTIPLSRIPHLSINQFNATLPGAILNAILGDNRTKVLDSPQVRASDGMKVTLKVGSRIPYATGSFQPGVGSVGVSPLVSTQFNYADVGVTVDLTPQVHSADEVTLHVEVTVSSLLSYTNLGGIQQPIIGQNANTADLRLREGEVNILGGLSQLQTTDNTSGIPGLVNIPVLGKYLFGANHMEKQDSELLIALIPHIVRTPDYTAENLRGIFAGNDTTVKINYAPKPDGVAQDGAAPSAAADLTPAAASQAAGLAPASAPVPAPGSAPGQNPAQSQTGTPPAVQQAIAQLLSQPGIAPQGSPSSSASQPGAAPQGAGSGLQVLFMPASIQASVSAPVMVNVQVANVADLFSASPIRIKFDPTQLRLNEIAPGPLFSGDGGRLTSVKDIRNDTGEAMLTVTRLPGSAGVSGSGSIATLNFTAVGSGASNIEVTELGLKNSQMQPLAAKLVALPVKVQ